MSIDFDLGRFKEQIKEPDDWKRANVYRELFEVSPNSEILELVYHALLNDDDHVAKACAMLLRAWEERSPATWAVLLEACGGMGFTINYEIIETIEELGFNDDEMVNALAGQIANTKYMVPDYIAIALGNLGNPTPQVIEALVWALQMSEAYFADDFARASAAHALGKLGVASPEVLRGLVWLRDNGHSSKEREAAQEALEKLAASYIETD